MTSKQRKKTMSREQADALYHQLKKNMQDMMTREKTAVADARKGGAKKMAKGPEKAPSAAPKQGATMATAPMEAMTPGLNRGHLTAITLIAVCLGIRVMLSAMEATGVGTVSPAAASQKRTNQSEPATLFKTTGADITVSKDEVRLLTSLDTRRAELEERNRRLDERENDLKKRDTEFAMRMAEIRELTDKLKADREKTDKKRENQLGQLANVYGSMNPQEAATLMEKLDVGIALSLIQRMPEKRIGQILALMSPEKALSLTRMLSSGTPGK